jgi:hypothetical protein
MEELLQAVPTFYEQDKSRIQSVWRKSPASKGMNTEAEEATALKAVTRQRLVKTQQTEKT